MRLAEINDAGSLSTVMTEPTESLLAAAASLEGPLLIVGGSGKMGPELARTLKRADQQAGTSRDITVAATFGSDGAREQLERHVMRIGGSHGSAFGQTLHLRTCRVAGHVMCWRRVVGATGRRQSIAEETQQHQNASADQESVRVFLAARCGRYAGAIRTPRGTRRTS